MEQVLQQKSLPAHGPNLCCERIEHQSILAGLCCPNRTFTIVPWNRHGVAEEG